MAIRETYIYFLSCQRESEINGTYTQTQFRILFLFGTNTTRKTTLHYVEQEH
jgi:hypothetical protein